MTTQNQLFKRLAKKDEPAIFAEEFTKLTGLKITRATVDNWKWRKEIPPAKLALYNACLKLKEQDNGHKNV